MNDFDPQCVNDIHRSDCCSSSPDEVMDASWTTSGKAAVLVTAACAISFLVNGSLSTSI